MIQADVTYETKVEVTEVQKFHLLLTASVFILNKPSL